MPDAKPDQPEDQPAPPQVDAGLIDLPYTPQWGDDAPRRPEADEDFDPFDRVNDWSWETLDVWDYGADTQEELDATQARRDRVLRR